MKRALQAMLALSLVAMLLATNVAAATSQDLEWGCSQGDTWLYDIAIAGEDNTNLNGEVWNITIESTSTIDDPLTNIASIDSPDVNITWANGTSIGFYALLLLPAIVAVPTLGVPVGNFDLLTTLYNDNAFYNGTVTNGVTWDVLYSVTEGDDTVSVEVKFSKIDGYMTYFSFSGDNGTITNSFTLTRQGIAGLPIDLSDPVTLAIIGGVVVLVLAAVVCKKK